ncbi:MAG: DUF2162 family putative transporter [Spirochaetota bacterium]|nr:DUF2162 family putative transporter [Spirochaetota bacterium]
MDESLLIAGITVAVSAFGVKTGLSASSILYSRDLSAIRRIGLLTGIFILYLLFFLIITLLVLYLPLQTFIEKLIKTLSYGMIIHIIIALGMFIWGISLLSHKKDGTKMSSRIGALYLSLPCPVCAMVIFITVSMTHSIFSISIISSSLMLFGIFLSVVLLTILLLLPVRKRIEGSGAYFLGIVMMIISLYFVLTVIIAPIYQEARDVYRLVSVTSIHDPIDSTSLIILISAFSILFGFGFLSGLFREKGKLNLKVRIIDLVIKPAELLKETGKLRN